MYTITASVCVEEIHAELVLKLFPKQSKWEQVAQGTWGRVSVKKVYQAICFC